MPRMSVRGVVLVRAVLLGCHGASPAVEWWLRVRDGQTLNLAGSRKLNERAAGFERKGYALQPSILSGPADAQARSRSDLDMGRRQPLDHGGRVRDPAARSAQRAAFTPCGPGNPGARRRFRV